MIKNLFKRNMIVIFAVAFLCTAIVTYSFIRSSDNTKTFSGSGYVHVSSAESEDKRVLFSAGSKYKSAVNSQIKFTDVGNVDRNVPTDNFIHYDDNSIAAFCDGVIVNVDELSSETSTMNHFHISPGMILKNTGTSYTAENSGMEIDFSNFLWKISENKYLVISKSINASISDSDQRDCGTYAEITYLDGKVIQIQTEDNVWQTISNDSKLILNNGSIVDLAMKNIKDQNGNVLLDFSRIIIDSDSNVELTPLDEDMESINDNVIPHFTINNTPGDSGADGTSGIIGLTGMDGVDGNKGTQGLDGESQDKRTAQEEEKPFPVFYVTDWKVTPNSCEGIIKVEDEGEVLISSTDDNLKPRLYLVDLDTGENIEVPGGLGASAFVDARADGADGVKFNFTGLKTDHSYMLYASAPIQRGEGDPYSRGFVSKTFWTDSSGVYIEAAAIDTNSYQVVAHTNNINSDIDVYIFKYPFEDYNLLSTLNLSTILEKYTDLIMKIEWPSDGNDTTKVIAGSKTLDPYTNYISIDINGNPIEPNTPETNAIKSDTHYYTMLLYDSNKDGAIDDYSTQILDTLTLKKRPMVAPPSLGSNRSIGGFDVTPGIIIDEDAAVTKYSVEFYSIDQIDTTGGEASKYKIKTDNSTKKPYEPIKVINLSNNSPASVSMNGLNASDYVIREVLTVYDNEKEYFVYSTFSDKAHLEESIQPSVYFEPFGSLDPGQANPLTALSPYYDTCVGILHIYPGKNELCYCVNEFSRIQISGDNFSYDFMLSSIGDDIKENGGDISVYDGASLPAFTNSQGEVQVYFFDYQDENKSWMSGLTQNTEYHITVYGDLCYLDQLPDGKIEKHLTSVGRCNVVTPPAPGLKMVLSTSSSSPNLLKDLRMAGATPSQLRNTMTKPLADAKEESYYNRQIETFYGFKITAYLNDYSQEKKYLPSEDEKIVAGKKYYIDEYSGTEVTLTGDNLTKSPKDNWYEYKEVPLKEEDYWFSKTFTQDEPWKLNDWQVYMLYDFDSKNDQLKTGVQVVGVPDANGVETYVLSSNGSINLDEPTRWLYPYREYTKNDDGTVTPTTTSATNRITSTDVKGSGLRYKVRPLHKIDSLFISSIEKGRNSTSTNPDYIVSSGGLLFDDDIFNDVLGGKTLEEAVLGDDGVIKKKGALGVTFIIEELFDYTGNPDDSSLNKQDSSTKVLTKDTSLVTDDDGNITKSYFSKSGDLYSLIDFERLNPYFLGLLVKDETSGEYVLTNDTTETVGHKYYFKYDDAYYEFDKTNINPAWLGLYENANHYVNYFENTGEKRIYIPFSRSIGDINLEHPYNDINDTNPDGKIIRHTVSEQDDYHYYYSVQANFSNSNQLANTITYRVYDAVDFYNTKNHLNNDREYVNWALLGTDPRITNPTDVFTDTWLIQDVQTVDENPKGEYVYQQVKGITSLDNVKPYTLGWYEKSGNNYVLTKDTSVLGANKYYINSGDNTYTQLITSSFSPKELNWYEETMEKATETSVDDSKTYYALTYVSSVGGTGSTIDYNIINISDVSPFSFCWYEYDSTNGIYSPSNDLVVSPDTNKDYYYYNGSGYTKITNKSDVASGIINPSVLGWYYGNKELTEKSGLDETTRFFIKYLINVHSTDELSSGAYSNYDSLLSPIKEGYQEYAKKLAGSGSTVDTTKRYYTQYYNENGEPCYKLVDLTANENKTVTNPSAAGWYVDETTLTASHDKYFDTEKEYFTASGVSVNSSVSPKTQGWFEKQKKVSNDTLIDYSKSYYAKKADGTYTTKINPNINPSQLSWYETAKKAATGAYQTSGVTYYAKRGESYVLVSNPINPNAIGWYESVMKVSTDSDYSTDKVYYEKIIDGNWNLVSYEKFDKANLSPKDLKWRVKDSTSKEKVVSTDEEVKAGTTYYIPIGQYNYVEYKSGDSVDPSKLGLFVENKVLSSDVEAVSTKTYYISSTDTYQIDINNIDDLTKVQWYVDDTGVDRIPSQDQTFDKNKTYYPSKTAVSAINTNNPFNPHNFEWYEDMWILSEDDSIDSNKEYAIRYLTNANGASAVTTDGLELAKITLNFNGAINTPTIRFFPCTYEYAKLHYGSLISSGSNCVFFDDDSYEELYGHQFIITWTINYHHYLSQVDEWHLCYPFDASAKLALTSDGTSGGTFDATYGYIAELREKSKFSEYVAYFDASNKANELPNGENTIFGENAYMVVPHNYKALDEPKEAPEAYSLQWDSGREEGTRFITTRVLVTDPYNSTFNYKSGSSGEVNHAYTNVYVVKDKQSSAVPTTLEEIKINNVPGVTMAGRFYNDFVNDPKADQKAAAKAESKAIEDIISANSSTLIADDNYAVGVIKVTDKNVSHDSNYGFIDDKGQGFAPAVLPIQLYSNKYVSQKESLHILSGNKYIIGSKEISVDSSDENWTFKATTTNNDKYAPLFTAYFNDEVNISEFTDESTLKLKPHIENQELKGYDVELIAPPEVIKDVAGIRLRFEICEYRDATTEELTGSPTLSGKENLGLFEAQMTQKLTEDTTVTKGKSYFCKVGFRYYEYKEDDIAPVITPNLYVWYEKDGETYKPTEHTSVVDGTTYYLKKGDNEYVAVNLDNINPKDMGWFEETYDDVKWTEDETVGDKKYLYQTDNVLYSMNIDKYLPLATTDVYSYNKEEGMKSLSIIKDGDGNEMLHMYFGIAAEELSYDPDYKIGGDSKDRSFNGKDGIRVYASYLYESDRGGYSYIEENSGSGNPIYSNKANSIINNKESGAFSVRSYTLDSQNNSYYFDAKDKNYLAFVDKIQGSESIVNTPDNVYSVTNSVEDTDYEDYKLNRFGSFFSVAEFIDSSTSSNYLQIKTTRYQAPGSEISQQLPISSKTTNNQTQYIPSLLTADSNPTIKIISWKKGKYNDENPASFGIMQFPKSNLYISFDDGSANDGTAVNRQQATLNYHIYNAESSNQIYALVTKKPVVLDAARESLPVDSYPAYTFNKTSSSSDAAYTVISNYKNDTEIQPTITLEQIMKTYVGQSKANYYLENIDKDYSADGYKLKDLFIPVYDGDIKNIDYITLNALPYNTNYSVSFWVWSLISESSEGSEYGWVSVPYSNLRAHSAAIDFRTNDPAKASFEKCDVQYGIGDNHEDAYINKSFITNIHNGDSDLYYVIDLIDNETGNRISHLYTASRTETDTFRFDLDGITGTDGAKTVYKDNEVLKNGQILMISDESNTDPYNSFKYGKLSDGNNRYKIVLRAYINGTGPATLTDPNEYDWENDPDSAYKVYRYIKDGNEKTQKDTTESHILNLNVANREKEFSINNDWDKLEYVANVSIGIDIKNSSNNKRSDVNNGPSIGFTINKPAYNSYSLAYEKYIPVIVRSHLNNNVQESVDITASVFNDKIYGTKNKEGGTPAPGLDGYYIFDYDKLKTFNMCADTASEYATYNNDLKNKVSDHGLTVNDTVTIFLLSWQDIIDVANSNSYLMQYEGVHTTDASAVELSDIQQLLANKVKDLVNSAAAFKQGGLLYTTEQYKNAAGGPLVTGLRMVSARNITISSKLIIIKPSHVFGEGKYSDEQLEAFAAVKTAQSKIDALNKIKDERNRKMLSDQASVRQAIFDLEKYSSEPEIKKYVEESKQKQIEEWRTKMFMTDEEIETALQTLKVEERIRNSYPISVINKYQMALDAARIAYGRMTENTSSAPVYYYEAHIKLNPNETEADKKVMNNTTVIYDPATGLPLRDKDGKTIPVTANSKDTYGEYIGDKEIHKAEGSVGNAINAENLSKQLDDQLKAAQAIMNANDKRALSFDLKLDSESVGKFGEATIDITCKKGNDGNNGHIINIKHDNVTISEAKTDGYGCIINLKPTELRNDYDNIVVTVKYHEQNNSDTQVDITDAASKCKLTIDDVEYSSAGQITETDTASGISYTYTKYKAAAVKKTYTLSGTPSTNNDKVYPTVTYTFVKQGS